MSALVLLAVAAWLLPQVPGPWDQPVRTALGILGGPAVALVVVLGGGWFLWSALRARSVDPEVVSGSQEEPLLAQPSLFQIRSHAPIAVLASLEGGSGTTTLTFNLAVALAVQGRVADDGRVRLARPVAVLVEGPLTRRLGLSPATMDEYLGEHPQWVGPEVVNLAIRHATGCELLCLPREGRSQASVRPLLGELRRHYDAVLLDGGRSDRSLLDMVADLGDALILTSLPSPDSVDAAGLCIERVFAIGLEVKTALVVNRVAGPVPPELELGFLYGLQLPDDPNIDALNLQGLPWCLDGRIPPAERFTAATRRLFSELTSEVRLHAS